MIWATVSSWSCFCWLYRASPSLAAKNIINLISVLTIWWCVVGRGCLLWPGHFLGKTLLAFALLHSVLQGQICLLFQVFLDFILLRSFSVKNPIGITLGLGAMQSLLYFSTLLRSMKTAHRQDKNQWAQLCSNQSLGTLGFEFYIIFMSQNIFLLIFFSTI